MSTLKTKQILEKLRLRNPRHKNYEVEQQKELPQKTIFVEYNKQALKCWWISF